MTGNRIRNNSKARTAGEDVPVPLSGLGVGLLGATGVRIVGNLITGNVTSAESNYSGGVVVVSGLGEPATAPTDYRVRDNLILHNDPDLFWDGTGSGNSFHDNVCGRALPRDSATTSDIR